MKKAEFLARLDAALQKRGVPDAADILEEYEQHFTFKLADGYGEEEIAAKLGAPEELAAQFEGVPAARKHAPVGTVLLLGCTDLTFGILAVLLASFGVVLAACALSFGLTGVCMVGNLDRLTPLVSLPPMPYGSALLLGLALVALTAASYIACVYFFAFLRQLFRAYGRFRRNRLAAGKGEAVLPALPVHPQFAPARRRRLRTALLVSAVSFGVCFVLGMVVSMLNAGAFEFWHVWGWFSYGA